MIIHAGVIPSLNGMDSLFNLTKILGPEQSSYLQTQPMRSIICLMELW